MTGILVPTPGIRAMDTAGNPLNGALLQFYLTGTTTPSPVYTSKTLGTPLSNPVVADSTGLFPAMFGDPTITYRAILKTSGGSTILDVDPVSQPPPIGSGAITSGMLAAGVAVANLGYTPLNKAGDTATNLVLASSTLGSFSAGYRGLPKNQQDGTYSLVLADAGCFIRHSSGSGHAHTIPPVASVAWVSGTTITFRNAGSGVITLTRGAGVTLTIAGSGTSKDVAIAQYGLATIIMEGADTWVASGVGLS